MSYVIKRPLMTEKSSRMAENNIFVFEVNKQASKIAIKDHIQKFFKVKVASVKTLIARKDPKSVGAKRKSGKVKYWKKAFVRLKKGEQIGVFENK